MMTRDALIEQLAKAEFERDGLVLSEVNRQTRLYESCHRFAKNAMPLIVTFVEMWIDQNCSHMIASEAAEKWREEMSDA